MARDTTVRISYLVHRKQISLVNCRPVIYFVGSNNLHCIILNACLCLFITAGFGGGGVVVVVVIVVFFLHLLVII